MIATPGPDDLERALAHFAKSLMGVKGVMAVTHAKDRSMNLIWTFIESRDKTLRRRIYATERELMARHPNLTFDFNVVALHQSPTGTPIVPDDLQGRVIMYRPAA